LHPDTLAPRCKEQLLTGKGANSFIEPCNELPIHIELTHLVAPIQGSPTASSMQHAACSTPLCHHTLCKAHHDASMYLMRHTVCVICTTQFASYAPHSLRHMHNTGQHMAHTMKICCTSYNMHHGPYTRASFITHHTLYTIQCASCTMIQHSP